MLRAAPIRFGRLRQKKRARRRPVEKSRRSIVRDVASSESHGHYCNACCMYRLTSLQSGYGQFESNCVAKTRARAHHSRRSCSAARCSIDSGTIVCLFLHVRRPADVEFVRNSTAIFDMAGSVESRWFVRSMFAIGSALTTHSIRNSADCTIGRLFADWHLIHCLMKEIGGFCEQFVLLFHFFICVSLFVADVVAADCCLWSRKCFTLTAIAHHW
jgi:hypothetical protein